jgi:hypothetical protein
MSRDWQAEFEKLVNRERAAFERVLGAMRAVHTSLNTESQGGLPDYVEKIDDALEAWKAAREEMSGLFEDLKAASRLAPESPLAS